MTGHGHIPNSFIEEIQSRLDIVSVISSRIELKKQGANYIACCPFHTEKTPSFSVSQTKQFYHCFGCGAHGDAIKFLREFSGMHFVEVVEMLADSLGLKVPYENQPGKENFSEIYEILKQTTEFYQSKLYDKTAGKKAVRYLRKRGITGDIARRFGLGYAPLSWESLGPAFKADSNKYQVLQSAGLCIEKAKNRFYDRFRDRIMFPIRDRRGRTLGFGGRIIDSGTPKYLNSPETKVFNKSKILYGLYEAFLPPVVTPESLIIVEGNFDVVTLAQFGITNVVATLGTAITEDHIQNLFQQTQTLFFCFDGDKAGRTAAHRALVNVLPHITEGRRVRFVFLPEGLDPDSYVRTQGKDKFLKLLDSAKSLSDVVFEYCSKGLDLNEIEGRVAMVSRAKPLLVKLSAGIFKEMMYERLAALSSLDPKLLNHNLESRAEAGRGDARDQAFYDFDKKTSKNKKTDYTAGLNPLTGRYSAKPRRDVLQLQQAQRTRVLPSSPAIRALALLLEDRTLLQEISPSAEFEKADRPGNALLCASIEILKQEPDISVKALELRLSESMASQFKKIAFQEIAKSVPKYGTKAEFTGAVTRLKERVLEQEMEELLMKAKDNQLSAEEKIKLNNLIKQRKKDHID